MTLTHLKFYFEGHKRNSALLCDCDLVSRDTLDGGKDGAARDTVFLQRETKRVGAGDDAHVIEILLEEGRHAIHYACGCSVGGRNEWFGVLRLEVLGGNLIWNHRSHALLQRPEYSQLYAVRNRDVWASEATRLFSRCTPAVESRCSFESRFDDMRTQAKPALALMKECWHESAA